MKQVANSVDVTHSPVAASTRLIRLPEVRYITGLSRSYIYELAKKGLFPESISLVPGGTSRAWVEAEVQEWVNKRLASRDMGEVK